jgi:stage V sporulation protein SpoVS
VQTFYKHDSVRLRGVGAGAGNIADKAIIIAKEEVEKRGNKFLVDLSFTTVMFGEDPKTGILKKLVKIDKEKKEIEED